MLIELCLFSDEPLPQPLMWRKSKKAHCATSGKEIPTLPLLPGMPIKFDEYSSGCSVTGNQGEASSPTLFLVWLLSILILILLPLIVTVVCNVVILALATYYR